MSHFRKSVKSEMRKKLKEDWRRKRDQSRDRDKLPSMPTLEATLEELQLEVVALEDQRDRPEVLGLQEDLREAL